MANNVDRPERRRQNGSLSLKMRPFSVNFSAQCWGWGCPQRISGDFLFLVGFLIEDWGEREKCFVIKNLSK